jgi:NitT/TauT family transport system substrate-binding protein
MVVWIARDRGHFAAEGIELDIRSDRAAGLVTDSILSGQVDMVYGGVTTLMIPYSKGAPLVSVATTSYDTTWEVIVLPDSPYKKVDDLKGKTVAVIAANTSCVLALRTVFEKNGWPADFLKFTVVSPPDQVAAFAAKRVDASCMFDPFRLQMIKQFGGRAIWHIRDAGLKMADGNLVMGRDFVEKNPKTVAAIQRAIGKAADEANRDPEIVYSTLAAALKRDVAGVSEMSVPKFASPPAMPNEVRQVAEALHRFGFVKEPIDVKGYDRSGSGK